MWIFNAGSLQINRYNWGTDRNARQRFTSRKWHPRRNHDLLQCCTWGRPLATAIRRARLSDARWARQKTWLGIATSASRRQTLKPRCPTGTRDANSISVRQPLNTQLPIGATAGCGSARPSGLQPQKKRLPTRLAEGRMTTQIGLVHPLKRCRQCMRLTAEQQRALADDDYFLFNNEQR